VIRPKRRVRSRQSRHEDEDVSVSERLWGDMLSDDSLSDDIPLPKYGYVYSRFNRRLLYWFFLKKTFGLYCDDPGGATVTENINLQYLFDFFTVHFDTVKS